MAIHFGKHVKVRQEKRGAVVFDTLTEKVFVANETGADILRLLGQGLSAEEIATALAQEYSAEVESISGEVCEFVDQLRMNGVLREEG